MEAIFRGLVPALCIVLSGCLGTPSDPWEGATFDALLMEDPFPDLEVRVHYVEGREPHPSALVRFQETLHRILHKDTIEIFVDEKPIPPVESPYTMMELSRFLRAYLVSDGTRECSIFQLHVFYLNGAPKEGVLGMYHMNSLLLFKDHFSPEGGGSEWPRGAPDLRRIGEENVERSVLIHELGHAIGLVNNGVPMVTPREDANHPKHSTNDKSVMYHGIHTSAGLLEYVADNQAVPYRFDEEDLRDIRVYQENRGATRVPSACARS